MGRRHPHAPVVAANDPRDPGSAPGGIVVGDARGTSPGPEEINMVFERDMEDLIVRLRAESEVFRIHTCRRCIDCGECACEMGGRYCHGCGNVRANNETAQKEMSRWQSQLDAGCVYIVSDKSRLLHRWDCKTLNSPERGMNFMRDMELQYPDEPWRRYWPRLPELKSPEQVRAMPRRYRGCQLCKPDPV